LFGVGKLLLGATGTGLLLLALGALGGVVIYLDLSRRGWATVVE
jgi:TM2 domain-containing membrane protein YozV